MDVQSGAKAGKGSVHDERGSVLVEFAFVFALFVLVIYAIISFGVILAAKNSITHAAAEGARAAVAVVDDPMTTLDEREERAKEKVGESLAWFKSRYEPGDTTASIGPCVGTLGDCITVTITYPYDTRPIVAPPPGLGLVIPSKLVSTAVVELT